MKWIIALTFFYMSVNAATPAEHFAKSVCEKSVEKVDRWACVESIEIAVDEQLVEKSELLDVCRPFTKIEEMKNLYVACQLGVLNYLERL
ncbi:MAG: hypothetical protein AB8E15_04715 [Bdellovibrionales bacterium]